MRNLALLTLSLAMLSPVSGVDRIDFSKATKNSSEPTSQSTSPSEERVSAYLSDLSLSDLEEISKMQESRFFPFVANVQKGENDQPRFSRINNPLYLKSIAVSALIRNQAGKKARHEIRDLSANEIIGEYETNIEFNPSILGKEYSPGKLDITNRNYEVRWFVNKTELGRMLFGKHGTRMLIR